MNIIYQNKNTSSGGNNNVIDTTFTELINNVNNYTLLPGRLYSFVYRSCFITNAGNDQVLGNPETIIVQATSDHTISNVATSLNYQNDIIEFDLNNVLGVFTSNFTGWISRRVIPERSIDCDFDCRGKTRRWDGYNGYIYPTNQYSNNFQDVNIIDVNNSYNIYIKNCVNYNSGLLDIYLASANTFDFTAINCSFAGVTLLTCSTSQLFGCTFGNSVLLLNTSTIHKNLQILNINTNGGTGGFPNINGIFNTNEIIRYSRNGSFAFTINTDRGFDLGTNLNANGSISSCTIQGNKMTIVGTFNLPVGTGTLNICQPFGFSGGVTRAVINRANTVGNFTSINISSQGCIQDILGTTTPAALPANTTIITNPTFINQIMPSNCDASYNMSLQYSGVTGQVIIGVMVEYAIQ